MMSNWIQLPYYAPIMDTIAKASRPSDLMNFIVAIGYNPPDNWRWTYLAIYREISGLVPWIHKSMNMGCTVTLIGLDVRRLAIYVSNSVKYPLREDTPLVIWPVCTLPWQECPELTPDDEQCWLMSLPFNPLDNKLGVFRMRKCESPLPEVFKREFSWRPIREGSITEPPHSRVTHCIYQPVNMRDKLLDGYTLDNLSGHPCIVLIGGLIEGSWGLPAVYVEVTPTRYEICPPIFMINDNEPNKFIAYSYCCNTRILARESDFFVKSSFSEMNEPSKTWNRLRTNEMAHSNSSNASVISMKTPLTDIRSGIHLFKITGGRPMEIWNMVLPSACKIAIDQPPVMPHKFLDELLDVYDANIRNGIRYSVKRHSEQLKTKIITDTVLKKYSEYIV